MSARVYAFYSIWQEAHIRTAQRIVEMCAALCVSIFDEAEEWGTDVFPLHWRWKIPRLRCVGREFYYFNTMLRIFFVLSGQQNKKWKQNCVGGSVDR